MNEVGPFSVSFTITLGLIKPLFPVATKCRDRPTRPKAIAALHLLMRVRRLWDSWLATTIARFVVEREGHSDVQVEAIDIPEAHGVRIVSLAFCRAREQIAIGFQRGEYSQSSQILNEITSKLYVKSQYPAEVSFHAGKGVPSSWLHWTYHVDTANDW